MWRPEFKCQVTLDMPAKGKIEAFAPKGLQMVRANDGEGYVVASESYTLFDMLEDQGDEGGK